MTFCHFHSSERYALSVKTCTLPVIYQHLHLPAQVPPGTRHEVRVD